MKIKRRLLCLTLAVMLIVAMAVPASAYTVAMGRQWGDFTYGTSDTCYLMDFTCVIESGSPEYTLRTDVAVFLKTNKSSIPDYYYDGSPNTLISTNAQIIGWQMSHINCYHYLSGNYASFQRVAPG